MRDAKIITGDAYDVLCNLDSESVQMCVTSPPYYALRDYGVEGQIGNERTPREYIKNLLEVFSEVHRVLKPDGTLWVNIGDSYCGTGSKGGYTDPKNPKGRNGQAVSLTYHVDGCKPKDMIGIPWMLAFALRKQGWYLRQDIIWHKPNPMPESVTDRCVKSHEYIFLLSKSPKYYFDYEAIKETAVTGETVRDKNAEGYQADYLGGQRFSVGARVYGKDGKRNKRDVWDVTVKPTREAHFSTFPKDLILPCILAGSKKGDTVLDPFNGSGTTGIVCLEQERNYIGIELNPEYVEITNRRIAETQETVWARESQTALW